MRTLPSRIAGSLTLTLALGACSPGAEQPPAQNNMAPDTMAPAMTPSPEPSNATVPNAAESSTQGGKTIGLEGLGDLRLGQPVPKGSHWGERGAQIGGECRTISSPDYPGLYGMVIDGKLRRITVGQRSDVTLVEGIGVGSTERDVMQYFAGFRAEPHKYEAAPAKYLTAPNAASGDPAVRFEIGQDGKVKMIHVGMMPQLAYVEGCA